MLSVHFLTIPILGAFCIILIAPKLFHNVVAPRIFTKTEIDWSHKFSFRAQNDHIGTYFIKIWTINFNSALASTSILFVRTSANIVCFFLMCCCRQLCTWLFEYSTERGIIFRSMGDCLCFTCYTRKIINSFINRISLFCKHNSTLRRILVWIYKFLLEMNLISFGGKEHLFVCNTFMANRILF